MTHYNTLGIAETATADEIKRAYRKLASQHHPDKGGDTAKFQEIQTAYDVLSDDNRRRQYDHERQNPGGFRFSVNGQDMSGMPGGMEDILRTFGFNFGGMGAGNPFGHMHQPRRNKDLRISIDIPLASTLEEQKKTVSVATTNGDRETVEVTVPRGVTGRVQMKYPGIGDNFFASLPRGDLYVNFNVQPDPRFEVDNIDLYTTAKIDCFDAVLGTEIEVTGLDGGKFLLTIPAGTQHGNMYRMAGQGLWQMQGSQRGNLIVKIAITIPTNLSKDQLELISKIKQSQ